MNIKAGQVLQIQTLFFRFKLKTKKKRTDKLRRTQLATEVCHHYSKFKYIKCQMQDHNTMCTNVQQQLKCFLIFNK